MLLQNKLERIELNRKWEKLKENKIDYYFINDLIKDTDNLLVSIYIINLNIASKYKDTWIFMRNC